ncbi:glycosyltransferase family 25 protein [Crateriforma conspicua]|uniref:Glycosyltransferase family 25 (LPS biosynthesis protein) n=1 Tax=Crateriforma conspicua TaxID=2527996 RepID=A0A5C5Y0W4_9PLAN|nr:glycosyltransferase family 25 protein [Crateriforma conspicua]TWT68844.1 Glycosyltransferase family 25 (LPS biosynthesis protein) [Crateriforma conspicua]
MLKSHSIVDRCFLINLDRRPDRLREWLEQLPDPWPLPEPERFPAIDGRHVATPPQWRAGNGAWGCYRSHLLILEKCLTEHIDSYVVFEDDAGFTDDFAERFTSFVDELPADWGLAYLGGQHLYAGKHPPQKVSEHVYRPYNVNRTHAFMVRGRENMKALYRHLTWNDWHHKHHIDHHLGRFIQRRYEALVQGKNIQKESIAVYTPDRWMVGQLPTKSNICGRKWNQTRFFNDARNADHSDAPFFAVLGPHRAGTSCVAMVMHHLGVHMGNQLGGYEATGGGEAVGLAQLCEKSMRFPATDPLISDQQLTQQLKSWIVTRKSEANRDKTVAGGKYPHLCRFAEHLHVALGDSLRIITVNRDIEASIRSLQDRSRKHAGQWFAADDEECERLQRSLLEHRDRFIESHPEVPVFKIEFAELTAEPDRVIGELIEFLGIEPTDDEIASAIAHVNPDLRKHG